ncbi:alginate lyase family protein [Vibrio diabolicus]|uniref:alginate lyase family protein n=1 Tax=Vibrio diabolicus TaxID=50719 RepID=UPI00232C63F9|nr:alginate lyase family protein [Vibrio diabolicus]
MSKIFSYIKVVYLLGLMSIARLMSYKLGVYFGFNDVRKVNSKFLFSNLFDCQLSNLEVVESKTFKGFGHIPVDFTDKYDWFYNILSKQNCGHVNTPWYHIPDFDGESGDIKGVWELSRLDWVLLLAVKYKKGDEKALVVINYFYKSWLINNPPYIGPNWKCAQEASIRVMNVAISSLVLGTVKRITPSLSLFLKAHLKRIEPTISYAIAQNNNHGTSEAAALFIGGSWLIADGDESGNRWQKLGRKWLENRAKHLVAEDGTFSQYSVNYHRVMLDTYSMAELWRRELEQPQFSEELTRRIGLATRWLFQLVDPLTGDTPNLGHNDGARLLQLTDTGYRDFRPSVQLASVVFLQACAWQEDGDYDEALALLQLRKPQKNLQTPASFHFEHGGYIGLRNQSGTFALFNYPKFRFRPAQNDALHVDLWRGGVNLLRDGGTFSYNAGQDYIDYYGGTQSHNTIQFDGHEQMPRLGRFLLGDWLKAKNVSFDEHQLTGQAGYRDYLGCEHHRKISLTDKSLMVTDQVQGIKNKAVLRWRLNPDNWHVQGKKVTNGTYNILIDSDVNIDRLEIVEGQESRYYYQESSIPVLEVEISSDGKITTEYQFY